MATQNSTHFSLNSISGCRCVSFFNQNKNQQKDSGKNKIGWDICFKDNDATLK